MTTQIILSTWEILTGFNTSMKPVNLPTEQFSEKIRVQQLLYYIVMKAQRPRNTRRSPSKMLLCVQQSSMIIRFWNRYHHSLYIWREQRNRISPRTKKYTLPRTIKRSRWINWFTSKQAWRQRNKNGWRQKRDPRHGVSERMGNSGDFCY